MASANALKTAKKELRTLMKQKLKGISQESVNSQSKHDFRSILSLQH
jgi:5-formyltetrahydrofolate cyclo-ligase